jgi:hypothetical protein
METTTALHDIRQLTTAIQFCAEEKDEVDDGWYKKKDPKKKKSEKNLPKIQGRNQKTDEENKERNMEGVRWNHHGKA